MIYEPHDLFLNTDTKEIDVYHNLTSYKVSYAIAMTDEEVEKLAQTAIEHFEEMLNAGVYVEVYEIRDENGHFIGYQTAEGIKVA